MKLYYNADTATRYWPTLVNPWTRTTLELLPGEQVELGLPDDFEDPYLELVPTPEDSVLDQILNKGRDKPVEPPEVPTGDEGISPSVKADPAETSKE